MNSFFKKACVPAALLLALGAGNAIATPVDDIMTDKNGIVVFEDDSAESVFRFNAATNDYAVITTGEILVGDYVLGIQDFPAVSGVVLDTVAGGGDELTGVLLFRVQGVAISPTDIFSPIGREGTITFQEASLAAWSSIAGINLAATGTGYSATDKVGALIYEQPGSPTDLDLFTQNRATALGNATDGTLQQVLGFGSASSFGAIDFADFNPANGGIPGVDIRGNYKASFNVLENHFVFDYASAIVSGTNVVNSTTAGTVQDDTQLGLHPVPEPASIALLGIGLLGLAGSRRRRA